MNLNKLSEEIYNANKEKGFWDEPRTNIECLALAAGECHEAIEADRKGLQMSNHSKRLLEDSMKLNFSLVFKNHVKTRCKMKSRMRLYDY